MNTQNGTKQSNGKVSLAQLRWRMLLRALQKGVDSVPGKGSIRQFSGFNLFTIKHSEQNGINGDINGCDKVDLINFHRHRGQWFELIAETDEQRITIHLRLNSCDGSIIELFQGFDNTGNICIWPSEEVLAYYCCTNRELCQDKIVCELGGGMTCLSGLFAAITSKPKRCILTDGNERCMTNVERIVKQNSSKYDLSMIETRRLLWDDKSHFEDLIGMIDVLLCSDCLYFDQHRHNLLDVIEYLLKDNGLAVLLAPCRGDTLQTFVELARTRFNTEKVMIYDTTIWQRHENYLNNLKQSSYIPDLHYPHMLVLRKQQSKLIFDYW